MTEQLAIQDDSFLETLPEATSASAILVELLMSLATAKSIIEVNIAAGVALNRLTGRDA